MQEDAHQKIMEMSDTPDLRKSIRKSEGPIDEPIVVEIKENKYMVLEGNRRVAVVKQLFKMSQEKIKNEEVEEEEKKELKRLVDKLGDLQVKLLKEEADTPENRRGILGIRHTIGQKEWSPYQKAKIVREYEDDDDIEPREIGRLIGTSTREINRLYRAFGAFDQFLEETDSTDHRKFSYFEEAAAKPNIRKFLGMDYNTGFCSNDSRMEFYDWITPEDSQPPRIPMAIDVRKLSKIYDHTDAWSAFDRGSTLDDAYVKTQLPKLGVWKEKVAAVKELDLRESELKNIGKNKEKRKLIEECIERLQEILEYARKTVISD